MSARHLAVLAVLGAGVSLVSCSGEVVVDPPDGGAGGSASDGGGGADDYDCDQMCDVWITKLPHCNVQKCLEGCQGLLAQGEAEGCLPEAMACLDRYPVDSEDCAGGCNNVNAWVDCLAE